jgi:hypothetical protein
MLCAENMPLVLLKPPHLSWLYLHACAQQLACESLGRHPKELMGWHPEELLGRHPKELLGWHPNEVLGALFAGMTSWHVQDASNE